MSATKALEPRRIVDADGHILEPLDLWDRYIDPNFRDRAPRIVRGENGKERLVIEEHTVGTAQRGIGSKAQPLVGHHRLGPA